MLVALIKIITFALRKEKSVLRYGELLKDIKDAVVAQLVEHWLPKPRVAGSSPVYRS